MTTLTDKYKEAATAQTEEEATRYITELVSLERNTYGLSENDSRMVVASILRMMIFSYSANPWATINLYGHRLSEGKSDDQKKEDHFVDGGTDSHREKTHAHLDKARG